MKDYYNRKIDTIRVSVTDRCNLRCIYCYSDDEKKSIGDIPISRITDIIRVAVTLGINRIKLTGGEPLVRRDIADIVYKISKIPGIEDISLTTNGTKLTDCAATLKEAGLNRVNVSLDTLDKEKFIRITGYDMLDLVFSGINEAKRVGLTPVKINTVLMDGINSNEIDDLRFFCNNNGLEFQLINQMTLDRDKKLSENSSSDKPPDCKICNRIRLTADGKLLPCLFSENEIDISDFGSIEEAITKCIMLKPERGEKNSNKKMYQIGG